MPDTAPQLFASANGATCSGREECHWCGSPTGQLWQHDDAPIIVGQKRLNRVARPGSQFACVGCWMFRFKRVTVQHWERAGCLPYTDGQCPLNWGWIITDKAIAIRKIDHINLIRFLIKPPKKFVASILDGTGNINRLHLAPVNDVPEIKGETNLHFTINNIPHDYTIYELKTALEKGEGEGKSPGVQALLRLLSDDEKIELMLKEERQVGRPVTSTNQPKSIVAST